eukprot:TRINITY_DN6660_c0_g1_i1.p1 TRINITY_DN6660_c0_g1~~TRINITY_DN6660_c0_g1_i1.p1  ORF type:complete len:354 (+),score=83.07 TRINITY_DN6660_c0_g1_i1:49-1062(+)
MAMLGTAAAIAAGAATSMALLKHVMSSRCFTGPQAVLVPIKKRASTNVTQSGQAFVRTPDMFATTKCYITIVGDMLMYGQQQGHAGGSVHLQGISATCNGREIVITKDGDTLAVVTMSRPEEAESWAEQMSVVSTMSENLPKLFSIQGRELLNLGQRNQEFETENRKYVKLLSMKRRECTEVERKANDYAAAVGQRSREAAELRNKALSYAELAAQREADLTRLRLEVEEEKRKHFADRLAMETKVAMMSAEANASRNEVAELSAEVISVECAALEKDMEIDKLAKDRHQQSKQLAVVRNSLVAMQELLANDQVKQSKRRQGRISMPSIREPVRRCR